MLPAFLLLLLPAMSEAAPWQSNSYEGPCRPKCSSILLRLPEVRPWCWSRSTWEPLFPAAVPACGPASGFHESQVPLLQSSKGAILVATTGGFGALMGRTRAWRRCKAERHGFHNKVYFGAVWDYSTTPCNQQYEVWLAMYNATPCWYHSASEYQMEWTVNRNTDILLPQNRIYQCRHCSFNDYTGSDFMRQNDKYVIINNETLKVYLYLSCNTTGGASYPTLKPVNTTNFTCDGCRMWNKFALENVFYYGDCTKGTKTVSVQTAIEIEDEIIGKCKRDWNSTVTSTELMDRQEASTEANRIPNIVQEAMRQLKMNNISNATQMLTNLEIVINASKILKQNEVSESLKDFERFAKKQLHTVNTSTAVMVEKERSTLVIAAGIIGAVVSTDREKVDLLQYGQNESSVERILARSSATAGVLLPLERDMNAAAIAVAVYRQQELHISLHQDGLIINSDVISIQVEISHSSEPINYVDIFLKPREPGVRGRCGMWNLTYNAWDFDYCTLLRRGEALVLCRCRHLTHFAQLVTDADLQWGRHARPLEVLSLAGVFASLLGFVGLTAAALIDRHWRQKPGTRVLLQLGGAVAARDLLMALVCVDAFRPAWLWPPEDPHACQLLGVALHYALLAAAAWTTAAAVLQLLRLSTVAGAQAAVPHVVLVSSACSWLLPLLPVAALAAAVGLEAGYPLRGDSATDFLCYPQGVALYTAVVLPVALCTAVNAAIFLYLLLAVLFPVHLRGKVMEIRRHGSSRQLRRALTAVVLFFLLGLPWLLGPPARVPLLAYLFCLIATPQGMALFISFVVCNAHLRQSICAAVSRAAFLSLSCSAGGGGGYRRAPQSTLNTQINYSGSDDALLQKRHNLRTQWKLTLRHTEGKPI